MLNTTCLLTTLLLSLAVIHGQPYNFVNPLEPADVFAEVAIWESLGLSNEGFKPVLQSWQSYENDVRFRLYTRKMNSVGMDVEADAGSLSKSPMNPKVPTKVFIFGYTNTLRSDSVLAIKDAYLENGEYNVIVVDWGDLAKGPSYVAARRHAIGVANRTAKLLDALAESKISPAKSQHVIGHSLGAHIAGMASAAAKRKPGRCTGLDPAGPLFELSTKDGRVDSSNAHLVDVIHSAAGTWGFPSPLGHIDFYPNGGIWPQPGCASLSTLDDIDGLCSHIMSFYYFAYSISNPTEFPAMRCQSHRIIRGDCPPSNDTAYMGEHISFKKSGLYYLEAKLDIPAVTNFQSRIRNIPRT